MLMFLMKIHRHLELEEITTSFNLLVGKRGKIFLVYSYCLLLLHTNKNISPKEGSWCSYILSIWLPVVSLSFISSWSRQAHLPDLAAQGSVEKDDEQALQSAAQAGQSRKSPPTPS